MTPDQIATAINDIQAIKARNARVEEDKAWETSFTRRATISILTYLVIAIVFVVADFPRPWTSALVPAVGFILGTLSLKVVRGVWGCYSGRIGSVLATLNRRKYEQAGRKTSSTKTR